MKIKIPFLPYRIETSEHAIEKDEGQGFKRRYLKGVTSGIKIDGHGERMTMNAIKSFQRQAKSGDILLFEGQHGVNFTDDIGKLVDSEILPTGDWMTTYRLYDKGDNFPEGSTTLEKADKLWRQFNGIAPYTKAKQKGFSIEGDIPENGIVTMDAAGGGLIIDDVDLQGVVVVPKPAFLSSVAQAVYKALGLDTPYKIRKGLFGLSDKLKQNQLENEYFSKRMEISNTLDDMINDIMVAEEGNEEEKLHMIFDEYANIMLPLIMQSKSLFKPDAHSIEDNKAMKRSKDQIFKELTKYLDNLTVIRKRLKQEDI